MKYSLLLTGLILFLGIQYVESSEPAETLQAVIVISRHGIRGNQNKLKIPNKDDCPLLDLYQQVSSIGHQQNYNLGKTLAETYKSLLTPGKDAVSYNRRLHKFYASDDDKNLMSGNSVAMGLYDGTTFPSLSAGRQYPLPSIPVHTAPDHVLNYEDTCPDLIGKAGAFVKKSVGPPSLLGVPLKKKYENCLKQFQLALGREYNSSIPFMQVPQFAEQIILTKGHLRHLTEQTPAMEEDNTWTRDALSDKCLYPSSYTCTSVELTDQEANATQKQKLEELDTAPARTWTNLNQAAIHLATLRQRINSDKSNVQSVKYRTTQPILYVIQQFKKRMASDEQPNFEFFLGMNQNVQDLLALFGQTTPGRVPFGSIVFFELHTKNKKSTTEADWKVKIGYRRMDPDSYQLGAYKIGENGEENCNKTGLTNTMDEYYVENPFVCSKDITPYDKCSDDGCTFDQLASLVFDNATWREKCGVADVTYYKELYQTTDADLRSTQATLTDTDDDKSKYQTLFIVFLIVLLVLLIVCIVIIILQCLGICCTGSSSSSSSSSKYEGEEMGESGAQDSASTGESAISQQ